MYCTRSLSKCSSLPGLARLGFVEVRSKTCDRANLKFIDDPSQCKDAAEKLASSSPGWPEELPMIEWTNRYAAPRGCFTKNSRLSLQVKTGSWVDSRYNSCSEARVCLCASVGSPCRIGSTNLESCVCGNELCQRRTIVSQFNAGLFCTKDPATNFTTCSRPPICPFGNGTLRNSEACACGIQDCVLNQFCLATNSECASNKSDFTAYLKLEEGSCALVSETSNWQAVSSAAACDEAVTRVGNIGSKNSNAELRASSSFPFGCHTINFGYDLVFNTNATSEGKCTKRDFCLCSHRAPACVHLDSAIANNEVCVCGTALCGTAATGSYCSSGTNMCHYFLPCVDRQGESLNLRPCACGSSSCTSSTGLYCSAETSTCSKVAGPSEVIYEMRRSGMCSDDAASRRIETKDECVIVARQFGADDSDLRYLGSQYGTTTSEWEPKGCLFQNRWLFSSPKASRRPLCSVENVCICAVSLPTCLIIDGSAPNEDACKCGRKRCLHSQPFCLSSKNQCSADGKFHGFDILSSETCTRAGWNDVNTSDLCSDARLALSNSGKVSEDALIVSSHTSSADRPYGCGLKNGEELSFNSLQSSTKECNGKYPGYRCLCKSPPLPLCKYSLGMKKNEGPCVCGARACGIAAVNGSIKLFCDAHNRTDDECLAYPHCRDGSGHEETVITCACGGGSTLCQVGQFCWADENHCALTTVCKNTNGIHINPVDCTCNTVSCRADSTGRFCRADLKSCSHSGKSWFPRVTRFPECEDAGYHKILSSETCLEAAHGRPGTKGIKVEHAENDWGMLPKACSMYHSTYQARTVLKFVKELSWGSDCGSNQYSADCLCFSGPQCEYENSKREQIDNCMCVSAICSRNSGLFCLPMFSRCSKFPPCSHVDGSARSTGNCSCGKVDCESGDFCDKLIGKCNKMAPCLHTNGNIANSPNCTCGGSTCTSTTGHFCLAVHSQCTHAIPSFALLTRGRCDVEGMGFVFNELDCTKGAEQMLQVKRDLDHISSSSTNTPGCFVAENWVAVNTNTLANGFLEKSDESSPFSLCFRGHACAKTNGREPNDNACICGIAMCSANTGLYCTMAQSRCVRELDCVHALGQRDNLRNCTCGSDLCRTNDIDQGSFCFAARSKCGQAPISLVKIDSGLCEDVNGSALILDTTLCKSSAASLSWVLEGSINVLSSADVRGCSYDIEEKQVSIHLTHAKACSYEKQCACFVGESCRFVYGQHPNSKTCICGDVACSQDSYCYSKNAVGRCEASPVSICAVQDGSRPNKVGCSCGGPFSECNTETGLYCIGSTGECTRGYEIVTSGTCDEERGRGYVVGEVDCTFGAQAVTTEKFSISSLKEYYVPGCVLNNGNLYHEIALQSSRENCNGEKVCICFSGILCSESPPGQNNCICGRTTCTKENGMFCHGNEFCSKSVDFIQHFASAPTCIDSGYLNIETIVDCKAGLHALEITFTEVKLVEPSISQAPGCRKCGTYESGCNSWAFNGNLESEKNGQAICFAGRSCTFTDGSQRNELTCGCGKRLCSESVGLYCSADISQCSKIASCLIRDGSSENHVENCTCGDTVCNRDRGLVCESLTSTCSCGRGSYLSKFQPLFCELAIVMIDVSHFVSMGMYNSAPACVSAVRSLRPLAVGVAWKIRDQKCYYARSKANTATLVNDITASSLSCVFQADPITSCKTCEPGTFTNEVGLPACKDCLPGKYESEEGKTHCQHCLPGMFQTEGGKALCSSCHADTFNEKLGAQVCQECPSGFSQENAGSFTCLPCSA